MDNTDYLLSKYSYIFSQPLSPLSQYLKVDDSDDENADIQTEDGSDEIKLET